MRRSLRGAVSLCTITYGHVKQIHAAKLLRGLRKRSWPRWPEIAHVRNGGDGIATQKKCKLEGVKLEYNRYFYLSLRLTLTRHLLRWGGHPHRFRRWFSAVAAREDDSICVLSHMPTLGDETQLR